MNAPHLTVGVILFGTKYLKESLPSLLASDYPHLSVIFLDQEEGVWSAYDFIQKELPEILTDPRVSLQKGANLWHSGGHNVCIRSAIENGSDYYIAGSNDMLYAPDCFSTLIAALESSHSDFSPKGEGEQFAFAAPKLLRWDFENGKKTDTLDSAGLALFPSHELVDRGQGDRDTDQFPAGQIFGASGALVAFRLSALSAVAFDSQFFDEMLHYKNDVELAYRLNWAGCRCLYVPAAVAWHDRQLARRGIVARFQTARWAKESSFFGQLVLLAKHFSSRFGLRVWLATAANLAKRFAFVLIFEPYQFAQILRFFRLRAEIARRKNAVPRRVASAAIESLMS